MSWYGSQSRADKTRLGRKQTERRLNDGPRIYTRHENTYGKNKKLHFVGKEELPWRYLTDAVDADVPAFVAFITGSPIGHGVQHLFGELLIERAAVQLARAGCKKNWGKARASERIRPAQMEQTDFSGRRHLRGLSLSKSWSGFNSISNQSVEKQLFGLFTPLLKKKKVKELYMPDEEKQNQRWSLKNNCLLW